MTWRQAFIFASTVITLGGLGLLAIAFSAFRAGALSAALFIAPMGLALLATVVITCVRRRRAFPAR